MSFTSATKNPGPGAYNVEPTLNGKGRYTLSRFQNSGANIISPATSKRLYFNEKLILVLFYSNEALFFLPMMNI